MEERVFNRRLSKLTAGVIFIGVVLVLCGIFLLGYLYNSVHEAASDELQREAQNDKKLIEMQIQADVQTLKALAPLLEDGGFDTQYFIEKQKKKDLKNTFNAMFYCDKTGGGQVVVFSDGSSYENTVDEVAKEARRTIKKSLQGEIAISTIYFSAISNRPVYLCSIPVYEGKEVIGALAASTDASVISEILEGDDDLKSKGYINLVDKTGKYLIRSERAIVSEHLKSFLAEPQIALEDEEKIIAAMNEEKRITSSFIYEGGDYHFVLEPLGFNGWYLCCVNTVSEINGITYNMTKIMGSAFAVILFDYNLDWLRLLSTSQNNKELAYVAYHDILTGADNLPMFRQKLKARYDMGSDYSVVALNIHKFKFINGIFGVEEGNRLLCNVHSIITNHLDDDEFCCRESADLFYLYLGETNPDGVSVRMNEIMDEITESFSLTHKYHLLMYCGVVIASYKSERHESGEDLLIHVRVALEKAKGSHQNNIWFFDGRLFEKEKMENYVESHMHQALKDGEFKMFLQPKVCLKEGRMVGAEALVRWKTDEGMIFPDQFIPVFEKNGFCILLDMYMVEYACKTIREWMDKGINPISISVNQSRQVFYEDGYIRKLKNILEKYSVPPELITLEILERVATENLDKLNVRIAELQTIGFKISLDDFGSGYSSLNILGSLRLDELKLDRTFLRELTEENQKQKLVIQHIIEMTKKLNLSTVVEGVETFDHEQLMKSLGCDVAQEYYYSKPISVDDFNSMYMDK